MTTLALILGAALIAIGVLWWWRAGVGAERPASMYVLVGSLGIIGVLLCGCDHGPTEEDMAGCAVRSGGPSITSREVAECAVERARHEESSQNDKAK